MKHVDRFWVLVIAWLVSCAAAPAQNFTPPFEATAVVADNQTRFEAMLDYDGDGRMDAVSVWFPTVTSVRVRGYRNDGTGRLIPDWSVTYPGIMNFPFTGPSAVVGVGRFNADGLDDFVLTLNEYTGYWMSNGAGVLPTVNWVFAQATTISEVVAADFDGDGLTDVAYKMGTDLRVYLTQPSAPPVLASVSSPAVSGQFHVFKTEANGDGLPDVGAVIFGGLFGVGGQIRLIPLPAGVPQGVQVYPVAMITGAMCASGDIDGDGDEDVVAFSMAMPPAPPKYEVLRRTGPSTFALEGLLVGGPATGLADIDFDGDLDGVCCGGGGGGGSAANLVSSKFELSFNDGSGAFTPAFEIPGFGATHIAGALDLDSDGDIDLVAGRSIYYGRGLHGVPPYPAASGVLGPNEFVDQDGDGDVDAKPSPTGFQSNSGNGLFAVAATVLPPVAPPGTTWSLPGVPGDFDGDGDVDILVDPLPPYPGLATATHLLKNLGCGEFVDSGPATSGGAAMSNLPGSYGYPTPENPESCVVADLDLDGDLDIVVRSTVAPASVGSGNSMVWWNQGAGSFTPGQSFVDILVLKAADLDGDGIVDLVAHKQGTSSYTDVYPLRGLGGTWILPGAPGAWPLIDSDSHFANRPAIADFDGDGDQDVFSAGNLHARLYTNQGNGVFVGIIVGWAKPPAGTTFPAPVFPHLAFALDVNADGLVDVVTTPLSDVPNGMAIVLNSVLNSPDPSSETPLRQVFQPKAFADLDGDGDQDAVGSAHVARNSKFMLPTAGFRGQYGTGIPGSGLVTPLIGEVGPFRANVAAELRIRGGLGGASGYLAIGSAPANTPLLGGTLLITPDSLFPIQLGGLPGSPGEGSLTIPFVMPAFLVGASIYHQVGLVDPGAPFGVSASNGMRIDVGP